MKLITVSDNLVYVACGSIVKLIDCSYEKHEIINFEFSLAEDCKIVYIALSDDGEYVYASYSNKYIVCWNKLGEVIGSILHSKRPTAILSMTLKNDVNHDTLGHQSSRRSALIVSDKAGLIWGIAAPSLVAPAVLLAGHTASVITDMGTDGMFVCSADRDEKIRISKFPSMETIQSFCLGHTSVVTSLSFLNIDSYGTGINRSLMLSCGWDHCVILWNHESGSICDMIQYEKNIRPENLEALDLPDSSLNDKISVDGDILDSRVVDDFDVTGSKEEVMNVNPLLEEKGDDDTSFIAEAADEIEKIYDENVAGHFPIKVVASSFQPIVGVIFKNKSCLKLYHISYCPPSVSTSITSINSSTESSTSSDQQVYPVIAEDSFKFSNEVNFELPAPPCDFCFTKNNDIVILLPKPVYLQLLRFELSVSDGSLSLIGMRDFKDGNNTILNSIQSFKTACDALGN